MTAPLTHRAVRREDLDEPMVARMCALMELCYDNVDPQRFRADLQNKQWVLLLEENVPVAARGPQTLMGFSTIRLVEDQVGGKRVDVLFSGDTVTHPEHWGTKALQAAFVSFTMRHRLRHPTKPLYWLLLSKGYKTYLLLTNYFPTSLPRAGAAALSQTSGMVALRDRIASAWWGSDYDPAREILHFAEARDRVKSGVAPVDQRAQDNADVRFFLDKNPGWVDGDELVCLALIDWGLPLRFLGKALARLSPRRRSVRAALDGR